MKDPSREQQVTESVSLREYMQTLISEAERRNSDRFAAQDKALVAAFAASKEALAIKDRADRDALDLARQIQTYKDEKANELREQISRERMNYASKDDLKAAVEKLEVSITPLLSFMASQRGHSSGMDKGWAILIGAAGLVATVIGAVAIIVSR